jgi:hypothetical protein
MRAEIQVFCCTVLLYCSAVYIIFHHDLLPTSPQFGSGFGGQTRLEERRGRQQRRFEHAASSGELHGPMIRCFQHSNPLHQTQKSSASNTIILCFKHNNPLLQTQ